MSGGQLLIRHAPPQTLFNFLSCTAVATSHQLCAGNALHQTLMVRLCEAVALSMRIESCRSRSGSDAHWPPLSWLCPHRSWARTLSSFPC